MSTSALVDHGPLTESGIGSFSFRVFDNPNATLSDTRWSVSNGVYSGYANIARTPWLEILERSNGENDTSAVRFWYLDSHFLRCSSNDPAGFFLPSASQPLTDTIDTAAPLVNDNDLPFFISSELAVNTNTDSVWDFCGIGRGDNLSQGQTFATFPIPGAATRACVRRCPENAAELTDIPGWGFDANANAECLFDDTGSAISAVAPVYVEDSVQPLEFEERFAFPLYQGDGFWQCAVETRNSNSDPFTAGGSEITFQLASDGTGRSDGNSWFFDDRSDKRTLRISIESDDAMPFAYDGYALIDHNNFTIYRTSLERLNCNRLNPVADVSLPVLISSFVESPAVPADVLLGQTTQCQGIESLQRSDSSAGAGNPGFSSFGVGGTSDNIPVVARDFEISPRFLYADFEGFFIYQLDLPFLGDFRFERDTDDGEVFNRINSTGTSVSVTTIRFRDLGARTMAERLDISRSSGQVSRTFSYFICNGASV